ncbi:gluconate 2-dehydrogenase subunit 3 family protein [Salinirubellus salinus]|uniref:Gluconate 2-dehydrogenase subunit 3 family protein n=1 Tax=Salinirubellus salinus TaxID=1364945 RepID=A0A9E7R6D6_9EURY|nr:gluconate 2-dehydrogenase subunit 3 family protein [Salinirubellus salinus]UWM56442.1 gluconate 2-dehydrogenase subunit 3 family protein [Salinirubellus salinus]
MSLRLTRRDALAAIAAGGLVGGSLVASEIAVGERPDANEAAGERFDEHEIGTLVAVAAAVYPTAVSTDPSFVEAYTHRLSRERRAAMRDAMAALDTQTRRVRGRSFAALPPSAREATLRELGVDRVHPRPDGTDTERVRYHLVNTLLYALFSTPRGSELVGITNPVGYPGGYESLVRPPEGAEAADGGDST